MKIPPQVVRLLLLTVLIVGSYFIARHFLVPSSFGQFGWYRGVALSELRDRPAQYGGRKSCAECHDAMVDTIHKSKHKGLSCEVCHGPSFAHTEDPNVLPTKIADPKFCLRCHTAEPARPKKFPQINPADHYSDQACAECHLPHNPTEAPK